MASANEETRATVSDTRTGGFTPIGQTLAQRKRAVDKHTPETRQNGRSGVISSQPVTDATENRNGVSIGSPSDQTKRGRGRPRKPKTEYLDRVISEFSAELHDEIHVRSNLAQAQNILAASGLSEDALVNRCYQARSLTRERANISKYADSIPGLKNKMPYFFEVLRDLAGIREDEVGSLPPIHQPPP